MSRATDVAIPIGRTGMMSPAGTSYFIEADLTQGVEEDIEVPWHATSSKMIQDLVQVVDGTMGTEGYLSFGIK